jgi:hypothetical protein
MKFFLLSVALTAAACAAAQGAPSGADPRVAALESRVLDLERAMYGFKPDGGALAEVRELRDRVWPLMAQGQESNYKMIQCFEATCP